MKKFITPKEAASLLNDGDHIHTFMNPCGVLLGCDYTREEIIKKLKENPKNIEIGGDLCRKMKHAIVVNGSLFIENNAEKLDKFDPELIKNS